MLRRLLRRAARGWDATGIAPIELSAGLRKRLPQDEEHRRSVLSLAKRVEAPRAEIQAERADATKRAADEERERERLWREAGGVFESDRDAAANVIEWRRKA